MGTDGHLSRTCAHCWYWDPQSGKDGLCRAAAPRSHIVGEGGDDFVVRALWPLTRRDDWCGRWKGTPVAGADRLPRPGERAWVWRRPAGGD